MKKTIFLFAAFLLTLSAKAQFTFTASPGIQLNGASFGYKVQKFVPYLSLQMVGAKGEMVDSGKENDFNTGAIVDYTDTYTAKLNVILPTLGVRYYFMEANKLKAYGNLNFSKALLSGKVEDSTDPTNSDDEDLQDILKNTKFFTSQIGFGTEYFFDDNFSLGGEFGIQLMSFKSTDTYESTLTDPNTGNNVIVTNSTKFSGKLNPTYVKVSLNFYFGK